MDEQVDSERSDLPPGHTLSKQCVCWEEGTDLSLDLSASQTHALIIPRINQLSYTKIAFNEVPGEDY